MTKKDIEKFVASSKAISVKAGRTNFAEASEEFLVHAQKINEGKGKLSDARADYTDRIEDAQNALSNYLKSKYVNSAEVARLQKHIEDLETEKKQVVKNIRKYVPDTTEADQNLYRAYYWYQMDTNFHDVQKSLYFRAFAEWFDSWGMTMGAKDFDFFTSKLGVKSAGNKVFRQSGAKQFTAVMSEKVFVELLYNIIIELMVKKGIIENYEFKYRKDIDKDAEKAESTETPVSDTPDTTDEPFTLDTPDTPDEPGSDENPAA